jgi:uncharacterized membrane protein YeaQ/YmgE (transglycosylase-associated protein family)
MNFIIWLVVGGLIGWIASMIMKTDAQQGVILNVVVGIIGAMLGGWLLAPMFGTGTINQNDFSLAGLGDHPACDRQPGTPRQPALKARAAAGRPPGAAFVLRSA